EKAREEARQQDLGERAVPRDGRVRAGEFGHEASQARRPGESAHPADRQQGHGGPGSAGPGPRGHVLGHGVLPGRRRASCRWPGRRWGVSGAWLPPGKVWRDGPNTAANRNARTGHAAQTPCWPPTWVRLTGTAVEVILLSWRMRAAHTVCMRAVCTVLAASGGCALVVG